jgi:hypothetical protein
MPIGIPWRKSNRSPCRFDRRRDIPLAQSGGTQSSPRAGRFIVHRDGLLNRPCRRLKVPHTQISFP